MPFQYTGFNNDNVGIYNVLDYGAVGNGSTDDSAAIQAALTAVQAAGGGQVMLPAGSFAIESTLSMVDFTGVTLRGLNSGGQYATASQLLWTGAAGSVMLDMSGTIDCAVSDIGFFGNASAVGTTSTNVGIDVQRTGDIQASFQNTIDRCYFQNLGVSVSLGISAGSDQADTFSLNKCRFSYGVDGIGVRIRSTNALIIVIRDCQFINLGGAATTATAVHLERGGFKMYGCVTSLNYYGVRIVTPSGSSGIFGHHSESEEYSIYTDAAGNHQKANSLFISDLYSYDMLTAMMYLGNANITYVLAGVYGQPVTSNGDILVSDDVNEIFATGVVLGPSGAILRASDGTTPENVYGWYGNQGVAAWQSHLPTLSVRQTGTAAALPTLLLSQSDDSEEFIEFSSTVGVAAPVEGVAAKTLTTTHFLRCSITGVGTVYIPCGTIA